MRARKTKIVATLGPATASRHQIEAMARAGVDVFRLNFSHGHRDEHAARFQAIREVENQFGRPLTVLLDLQGPKLRLSTFASGGIQVFAGETITIDRHHEEPGDRTRVGTPHLEVFKAVAVGHRVLIDDGKVRLTIVEVSAEAFRCRVEAGSEISDRKGLSFPDSVIVVPSLMKKDRSDLEFGLSLGVDWVALSFVQQPSDLEETRKILGNKAALMAKIEKPSAVANFANILQACDGVMVARGDLGVEMAPERVPPVQRQIVRACRDAGKPVIVATQMLESMIANASPTRAEASDVATAVYEGADAVMLSAETAVGQHPVKAVETMDKIIRHVEHDPSYRVTLHAGLCRPDCTTPDAIARAAFDVADILCSSAIVVYTTSGSSALRVARERPRPPVLSLTPSLSTARQLGLVWGIEAYAGTDVMNVEDMVSKAVQVAEAGGLRSNSQSIVVVAGMPFGSSGSTNIIRVI